MWCLLGNHSFHNTENQSGDIDFTKPISPHPWFDICCGLASLRMFQVLWKHILWVKQYFVSPKSTYFSLPACIKSSILCKAWGHMLKSYTAFVKIFPWCWKGVRLWSQPVMTKLICITSQKTVYGPGICLRYTLHSCEQMIILSFVFLANISVSAPLC